METGRVRDRAWGYNLAIVRRHSIVAEALIKRLKIKFLLEEVCLVPVRKHF